MIPSSPSGELCAGYGHWGSWLSQCVVEVFFFFFLPPFPFTLEVTLCLRVIFTKPFWVHWNIYLVFSHSLYCKHVTAADSWLDCIFKLLPVRCFLASLFCSFHFSTPHPPSHCTIFILNTSTLAFLLFFFLSKNSFAHCSTMPFCETLWNHVFFFLPPLLACVIYKGTAALSECFVKQRLKP